MRLVTLQRAVARAVMQPLYALGAHAAYRARRGRMSAYAARYIKQTTVSLPSNASRSTIGSIVSCSRQYGEDFPPMDWRTSRISWLPQSRATPGNGEAQIDFIVQHNTCRCLPRVYRSYVIQAVKFT